MWMEYAVQASEVGGFQNSFSELGMTQSWSETNPLAPQEVQGQIPVVLKWPVAWVAVSTVHWAVMEKLHPVCFSKSW